MKSLAVCLVCGLLLAACSDGESVRSSLDPTRLSSQGLYSDIAARKVVPEAFEYRPDYALWSDGADKRRWMILPEGAQIDTSDMAHWVFPVGTKLFKEFSHDGKLLETRLVERVKQTGFLKNDYFMGTYIWRADQSDAVLWKDGRDNVLGTEHDVPKQKACIVCHQGEPGAVLGFSAVQLAASGALRKVMKKKWLSDAPERIPEWPGDDVQKRALGVMHANCGHCHAENAMADFMHLRFLPEQAGFPVEELDAYTTTVGVKLSDEWEDHPERFALRVVPGDPDASAIAYRMGTRGEDALVPDQMPPLATRKVDEDGLAAVRAWIESLAREVMPDAGVDRDDAGPDTGGPNAGAAGGPATVGGANSDMAGSNADGRANAGSGATAGSGANAGSSATAGSGATAGTGALTGSGADAAVSDGDDAGADEDDAGVDEDDAGTSEVGVHGPA